VGMDFTQSLDSKTVSIVFLSVNPSHVRFRSVNIFFLYSLELMDGGRRSSRRHLSHIRLGEGNSDFKPLV